MEDVTPPVPSPGGEVHEENPVWTFRADPILALAAVSQKSNELRLTIGLATDLSHPAELSSYINFLNAKQLVFGHAWWPVLHSEAGRVPSHAGEIIFGDALSGIKSTWI